MVDFPVTLKAGGEGVIRYTVKYTGKYRTYYPTSFQQPYLITDRA